MRTFEIHESMIRTPPALYVGRSSEITLPMNEVAHLSFQSQTSGMYVKSNQTVTSNLVEVSATIGTA